MPVQTLKVAVLPMDLACSGLITHSQEILIIGKSHNRKPEELYPTDDSEMKNVVGFK